MPYTKQGASMKRLFLIIPLFLFGCTNPYTQFYKGAPDATKIPSYDPSPAELKIYSSNDFQRDIQALKAKGFMPIGDSSFSAGSNSASERQVKSHAQKIGAHIVLVSSQYSHTVSGAAPLTIPKTTTSYSSGSATAYGSGGVVNAYGSGTTTTYGSQTVMMPYSVDRSNFTAIYFVKVKFRVGMGVDSTDQETKQRLQSNSGVKVTSLIEGSPAYNADILINDIVLSIEGEKVSSPDNFVALIESLQGKTVSFKLDRDGETLTKEITILSY